MPVLDISAPFANVFGEPGVSFMQAGSFFDMRGDFVRHLVTPVPGESAVRANWRERQALEQLATAARAVEIVSQIKPPEPVPKGWFTRFLAWRK